MMFTNHACCMAYHDMPQDVQEKKDVDLHDNSHLLCCLVTCCMTYVPYAHLMLTASRQLPVFKSDHAATVGRAVQPKTSLKCTCTQ